VPKGRYCEATTVGTDGVVVQTRTRNSNNHPVRSLSMLRDFFGVAATPPVQEGQCHSFQFIHKFIDRVQIREFGGPGNECPRPSNF
jgi:hypothetical protein